MNKLNETEKRIMIGLMIFGLINLSPMIKNKELSIAYFIPLIFSAAIVATYLLAPKRFITSISIASPPIETLSLGYFCKGRIRSIRDVTDEAIASMDVPAETFKDKLKLEIRYSFTSPKNEHIVARTYYIIPKEDYELVKEELKLIRNKNIIVRSNKTGSRNIPDLHYLFRYYLSNKTERKG